MQVELRILRYDPERDTKPHEERYNVESEPDGPRPRPPPQGQVRAGRHADLPPLVRPRRLRLGRDAHQRPQPAGVQDPRRPAGQEDHHRRAAARACRWSRTSSSTWRPSSRSSGASSRTSRRPTCRRSASGSSRRSEREQFDDTTKCILCAACTSSCPSFWAQPSYVGPAAIVNAHRFIFDSRDDAAEERLEILADKDGVWRAGRSSTAPTPARAGSTSPRRSSRSARGSWSGTPDRAAAARRSRTSSSAPTGRRAATPARPRSAPP